MSANRTFKGSLSLVTVTVAALSIPSASIVSAQSASVQKALESGRYDEALQAAGENRDDPATTFVAAQAAIRARQADRARQELRGLESHGDQAWQVIGKSGLALLDGNTDEAVNLGNEAVAASGSNPYAHYQLGLALAEKGDHGHAADAFARGVELKPDFAYAHYYAGLEYQRANQMGKAGDHFRAFLELAPNAPERGAVATLLRAMRG
jgi:tetratricopeptide (TPR) repeat protein